MSNRKDFNKADCESKNDAGQRATRHATTFTASLDRTHESQRASTLCWEIATVEGTSKWQEWNKEQEDNKNNTKPQDCLPNLGCSGNGHHPTVR